MAFWMVCMAAAPRVSIRRLEDASENIDELVDLLLLDDQRRRERDGVAGGAHEEAAIERLDEARSAPAAIGLLWDRIELDGADQPDIADVDDVRQTFQRMNRLLPIGRKLSRARSEAPPPCRPRAWRWRRRRRPGGRNRYSRGRDRWPPRGRP